ncbi:MAG TPA: glycine--tRNA ligase subunit beta, partial [Stellaceae bacterium]|nr:glycine--tRNA ligase subunit beta [Stellaceae bacterium]
MPNLLLELLTEEIPARMQVRAAEDLARLAGEKLGAAGLASASIRTYVTPRRLVLTIEGLPEAQADVTEERRGPRVGAPENAVQGFLKSAGIASLAECERRDTGKGVFYFAIVKRAGKRTAEVLPELLRAALLDLPWPKSMRFPAAGFRWVRPITSVLCLFDGKSLGFHFDGIPGGDRTRGHRLLSPGEITVNNFGDYQAKLRAAHVILDPAERRAVIAEALAKAAASLQLTLKDDQALLDEVT